MYTSCYMISNLKLMVQNNRFDGKSGLTEGTRLDNVFSGVTSLGDTVMKRASDKNSYIY